MKKHILGQSFEGKKGVAVDVRDSDLKGLESAIRALKKKVLMEGLIRDLRAHEYYEKPGDKKRREQAKSKKRVEKKASPPKRYNNNDPNSPTRGSVNGFYNGSCNIA